MKEQKWVPRHFRGSQGSSQLGHDFISTYLLPKGPSSKYHAPGLGPRYREQQQRFHSLSQEQPARQEQRCHPNWKRNQGSLFSLSRSPTHTIVHNSTTRVFTDMVLNLICQWTLLEGDFWCLSLKHRLPVSNAFFPVLRDEVAHTDILQVLSCQLATEELENDSVSYTATPGISSLLFLWQLNTSSDTNSGSSQASLGPFWDPAWLILGKHFFVAHFQWEVLEDSSV